MKHIVFLFPSGGYVQSGGYKIVGEYANRLVADGHKVSLVYAGSLFWRQKTAFYKLTNCVRYMEQLLKGYSCKRWFPLDKRVEEHFAFSLNYRHVTKGDIYICTSPYTAMYLNDYPVESSRKYYFIQDYENWGGLTDAKLRETYHFKINKIVISNWLHKLLKNEEHEDSTLVPNGFDFNYFTMSVPIEKKDKFRVAMLYHFMERKGCKYGFAALFIVKEKYPQLRVNIFGTQPRPDSLPDWYDYEQTPDKATHNRIYNESAIFLGTSTVEGWGLTIGEAMICGEAVVCTDNAGYQEMAKDGYTALVAPVRDAQTLANNIIRLIEDNSLRYKIAKAGNEFIKGFSLDNSYLSLKRLLNA